MGYEVIPFQSFMSGDLGLFAIGGAVLLTLVICEKLGYTVNEKLVKAVAYFSIGASLLAFVLKNHLWITLFF